MTPGDFGYVQVFDPAGDSGHPCGAFVFDGVAGSSSSNGVFTADVGAGSSSVDVPSEEFIDAHPVLISVDGAEVSAVPSAGSIPCSAASCSIINFVSVLVLLVGFFSGVGAGGSPGPGSVGGISSLGAYHSVIHRFVPGAVSFPAFSDADPAGRSVCAAVSPVDAPCTIPAMPQVLEEQAKRHQLEETRVETNGTTEPLHQRGEEPPRAQPDYEETRFARE
ncbi:hypothetical protein ACOSP7_024728 [Xanthoceras sorbifolium]